jgi:hypothetical protein
MSKPSSYNFIYFSQIFSKKFTTDNLAIFLKDPVDQLVYLPNHDSNGYYVDVPFKIGVSGFAIITSGWGDRGGLQD